jgi:hypothetical protein
MTQGFQQQGPGVGFCVPRSVPTPQHGQGADKPRREAKPPPRSFEPKSED